ncbi:MAG: hypothetical protein GC208_10575 [Alphaproteobacteria bacterium]|nr:hypothetical protein [Alphaproteobacteria bacterium]
MRFPVWFIAVFTALVWISGGAAADPLGTSVVVRVVGTSPSWGQEGVPAWQTAAPVKQETQYRLYDLQIGRNASLQPIFLALYAFSNETPGNYTSQLPENEWIAYRDAHLVRRIELSPQGAGGAETLAGLVSLFDDVIDAEDIRRLIVSYAGHGGPSVFFENAISLNEGRALLWHLRERIGFRPLIMDFSTNCDVGYFDFMVQFNDVANFALASEHPVGGWGPDTDQVDQWIARGHDANLHQFWSPANSEAEALNASVEMRHAYWETGSENQENQRVRQSLAGYDLQRFRAFMEGFVNAGLVDDADDLTPQSDLGAHVYAASNTELVSRFEAFRSQYRNNNGAAFDWDTPSYGFRVFNRHAFVSQADTLARGVWDGQMQVAGLGAAILPTSRAGQVGSTVTAFATMTNNSSRTFQNCRPTPSNRVVAPLGFAFQTTDPATNALVGEPGVAATLQPGGSQSFIFSIELFDEQAPAELDVSFRCDGSAVSGDNGYARRVGGINTFTVSSSLDPIPDIIALAATATSNGVLEIAAPGQAGAFAVGTFNLGAGDTITARPVLSDAGLPATLTICLTGATGACTSPRADSIDAMILQNQSQSYAVFARTQGAIPLQAAVNRINVEFRDSTGALRGSTSVAIRTR